MTALRRPFRTPLSWSKSLISALLLAAGILAGAAAGAESAASEQEPPKKLANTVRWSTASEVDNYGFDVYRGDSEAGPFTRLTKAPVPGAGTSDTPHKYSFEDDSIEEGKEYYYYVESIAMDGSREHFTPVAKVKAKYRQPPTAPASAFKITVEEDGVYRLTFERLVAAGWGGEAIAATGLGLACQGSPVPIHVVDGRDGSFGPGDWLEFIGTHRRGANSYFHPDSSANVYWLKLDDPQPARMHALKVPTASTGSVPVGAALLARPHLEREDLLLRFSHLRGEDPERWYWARVSSGDAQPLSLPVALPGRDLESPVPVRLKLALRGWSWQRAAERESADHAVEVAWNGTVLGQVQWDGQGEAIFEAAAIPAVALTATEHRLSLRVLPRGRKDGSAILDVAVLNWVELSYPRRLVVAVAEQLELMPASSDPQGPLQASMPVTIYGVDGSRGEARPLAETGEFLVAAPAAERLFVVAAGALWQPVEVRLDQPQHLAATHHQADYLMISHSSLMAAVEPLAQFHRQRGLAVQVVDVEDVYDEFSHGLGSAAAIRDFVSHAYHQWARPAPRFVLLVGDASWDPRAAVEGEEHTYVDWAYGPRDGTKFRHNRSTPYDEASRRLNRNLVPAGSYLSSQGHAASDNYFVAVDGTDHFPDLAIGRFPVVKPEEVAAIVDKTIGYMAEPEFGAWRSRMLWITNEEPDLQAQSDQMASHWAGLGYASGRLYPRADGEANATHQATLRQAFDEGYALVHFQGHGGRYIWRTAAPDYQNNADLFALGDLDKLAPNRRLPVVLSMTCYSAPFDHPTADSIGEKFLRVRGKGAVAVLAASWRNSPQLAFSRALIEEILATETLGEGIRKAKHRAATLPLIEQYNLLGDPALRMARPRPGVAIAVAGSEAGQVRGTITAEPRQAEPRQAEPRQAEPRQAEPRQAEPRQAEPRQAEPRQAEPRQAEPRQAEPLEGWGEVAWLGTNGEVLARRAVEIAKGLFEATLTAAEAAQVGLRGGTRAVIAYAASGDGLREALGVLDLQPKPAEPLPAPSAANPNPDETEEAEADGL